MLPPQSQTCEIVADARKPPWDTTVTIPTLDRSIDERRSDLSGVFRRYGVKLTRPQGRLLIEEGVRSDALYMIASGIVRTSRLFPDGRRHIVDFLGCGEVCGLTHVAEDQHLVEAQTDVICLALKRTTLSRLTSETPAIAQTVQRVSERHLAKSNRKMVAMGCFRSVERTAHFLAWLDDMISVWGRAATAFDRPMFAIERCSCDEPTASDSHRLPMTRREIADYLGLTLETVCRACTCLKEQGLVDMPAPMTFRIPDRAALDAFVLAERQH